MDPVRPLVSAVVPTYGRPQLVPRAVRSALGQTLDAIEVIVVIDGRDEETVCVLQQLGDPRVRLVIPPRHLGNADARNTGVREARAGWVALLDDDDEWLPTKLERQLRTAERSIHRNPIVTCRMIARSETQDFVWPRRRPALNEPLSEYFFCRSTPFTGEGMVVNSGIFTTRELLVQVPFRSALERHADPDWLLRAVAVDTAALQFVPEQEPLFIWHIERDRPRITNARDWRYSFNYAQENRTLFTTRGYAAFLLHVVSASAAAQGHRVALVHLLREAYRHGRPGVVDVLSHLGNFLLPGGVQRALAAGFTGLTDQGFRRGR